MYEARRKVFWFAVVSRALILLLQMVFNVLCPDHNADAFRTPIDPTERSFTLDHIVSFALNGLTRWDAQYFIHIAKYGYTYENTLAFYPFFPMAVRYLDRILRVEPPLLNQTNSIILLGVILNYVCFVKTALVLYDLTERVFKNNRIAYRSAVLFCVNPASIFFSALYTETTFAYLTFYCMLESLNNNPCIFLPLSLSMLVRSNGLVNIGFPVYMWLRNLLVISIPNYLSEYKQYHSNKRSVLFNSRHLLISCFQVVSLVVLSLLPFFYLQAYYYAIFCGDAAMNTTMPYHVRQYGLENDLLLPGEGHEFVWCRARIPLAYSHIQRKYWNVGFLRYYQFKQIPNFLLAAPILYLMLKCAVEFFKEHKSKFCTMEFYTGVTKMEKCKNEVYPLEMFVFVVHGLFLTLFCIFFVHIQVSTRLLCSATPLLYWYCALVSLEEAKLSKSVKELDYESRENLFSKWRVFFMTQRHYTPREKLIYGYFIGYTLLGCFMYSNFLPWT